VKPIRRNKGIKRRGLVSDIVIQSGGKVHGSQRGEISRLVYWIYLSIMKYQKERGTSKDKV
jgi:hypothetical protein